MGRMVRGRSGVDGREICHPRRAVYFYEQKALPKISMLDDQRIEYVFCLEY